MEDTQEIIELVNRLRAGDEQALGLIYDKYKDALYGLILRIVRDDAIAGDVLQESFVNIWKKAPTYDASKGTFFTWMLNICRNRSIDEVRKIERQRKGKIQIAESDVYTINGVQTPVDTIGLKDMVGTLPEKLQLMVEYIYFRGYTQQEVSEELDMPLGTVKTRIRSALQKLGESFILIILAWILRNT